MKKDNENSDLLKLFSQKKFVDRDFADDRTRIIDKYNELGYRDAKITHDSVAKYDDKSVDVFLTVDEGKKYYISDIEWVGNTVYPTETLNAYFGMYPGETYNQKMLKSASAKMRTQCRTFIQTMVTSSSTIIPIEEQVHGDSIASRCASSKVLRHASTK